MAPDSYDEFTDRQRTRVVTRPPREEHVGAAAIGNTQAFAKSKGSLFDGLSIAQVIAGAAAAATSVVLASKIGITGSVIGAAVSSVVTVVSSQLYRKFLTKGAEKLKSGRDALGMQPGGLGRRETGAGGAMQTRAMSGGWEHRARSGEQAARPETRTRIAPERLQAKAEAERAATQRKVVGFSVGAAVVALVASVAVILALTAGEGLGTKTTPIFAPATEEQNATENDASASQNGTDQNGQSSQGASNSKDTDTDASSSTPGTSSSTETTKPDTSENDNAAGTGSSDQGSNSNSSTTPTTPDTDTSDGGSSDADTATGSGAAEDGAGSGHSSSASSTAGVAAAQ